MASGDEAAETELTYLNPEPNVPPQDQRTHVVLTDQRFIEYLARVPRGKQKYIAAVMTYIKGCVDEITRLKGMESLPADTRGNVRVLKDHTTYFVRRLKEGVQRPRPRKRTIGERLLGVYPPNPELPEDQYEVEEKRVGIYTVLPKAQIPFYRRKFERETAQALDWMWRMMRLWIGEDGKGRMEMIDALQASNGKLMPAESGKTPMVNIIQAPPSSGGWAKSR